MTPNPMSEAGTENSFVGHYSHNGRYFNYKRGYAVIFIFLALCTAAQIVMRLNTAAANFMNFGFSNFVRSVLAGITSVVPFSLGETFAVLIPIVLIALTIRVIVSQETTKKTIYKMLCVFTALITFLTLSFTPAYFTSSADLLFGIDSQLLSADELYNSALILKDRLNSIADDISFDYASFSKMGYDFDELSVKLLNAYDSLGSKYKFIKNFNSRLKPIALSVPMTYTHISGVYTYYTGEANINTNFPDYTIPYTAAHEMAHQRGFARENEANFVAFLVCIESDDPYINYSGYLNMFEYIGNALYSSSPEMYYKVYSMLDIRIRCEMYEYSLFFDKYRDSTASEITGAINDTYLKSQGMPEGEKSYGLVVDLAVAYILENF